MKVILFGASGMVGQGALRECLADDEVERVLIVVRRPSGQQHGKLTELVHDDFHGFVPVADRLTGYDACLFCLGISSARLSEAEYRRITYDITLAAARTLLERNPGMTFIYVSGAGTDSSARGPSMWARVKGETENALRELPFKGVYLFRPGYIQPLHGITSRTRLYHVMYRIAGPLYPLLKRLFPRSVVTTEQLGRALLDVAKHGAAEPVLEAREISQRG